MIDNEQPKVIEPSPLGDLNNNIVIEDPSLNQRNENDPSRNKMINITTSVRSSIVKNKAPSIMSQEETPRKTNESTNLQAPVQNTNEKTITTYMYQQP